MQALKELYMFLRSDQELKDYVDSIQKFVPAFLEKSPEEFAISQERDTLQEDLDKLKLDKLETILAKMPQLPHITAYILKACEAFTIAFLMIPPKTVFDWHDHQEMNGISRCVYGDLTIRSLNPEYLIADNPSEEEQSDSQKQKDEKQPMKVGDVFQYPMDRVREEKLDSKKNRISLIYPDSYNIHEIRSSPHHISAFIDLLVPEYPDNSCHFFQTVSTQPEGDQDEEQIKIRKIQIGKEKVIGFDTLIKMVREKSLLAPKNGCPQVIIPHSQ